MFFGGSPRIYSGEERFSAGPGQQRLRRERGPELHRILNLAARSSDPRPKLQTPAPSDDLAPLDYKM
jgi:hypothetical protein